MFPFSLVRSERGNYNQTVNTVLDQEMKQIVKEEDLQLYTNQFLDHNRDSFLARVAGKRDFLSIVLFFSNISIPLVTAGYIFENCPPRRDLKVCLEENRRVCRRNKASY